MNLSGWTIVRSADGDDMSFVFPGGTVLQGQATLTIWANGAVGARTDAGNMVWSARNTWTQALNARNVLNNNMGEEEATMIQQTRLA